MFLHKWIVSDPYLDAIWPLGLFGPFVDQLKFLARQTLMPAVDSDEPIDNLSAKLFRKLVAQFTDLANCIIPRAALVERSNCSLAFFVMLAVKGAVVYAVEWSPEF